MTATLLYVAAALIVGIGMAHSVLGERYILVRLFRRGRLPPLFGGEEFTRNTLRFAWHITSIAWLGLAALLVLVARDALSSRSTGLVVGTVFLAHSVVAVAGSRGRHLSWIVFLVAGLLAIVATWSQS